MMMDDQKHPSIEDLSFEEMTFGESSSSGGIDLVGRMINHHHNSHGAPGQPMMMQHMHMHPDVTNKKQSLLTASLQQHAMSAITPPNSTTNPSYMSMINNQQVGSGGSTPTGVYNSSISLLTSAVVGSVGAPSSIKGVKDKRTKTDKSDRHAVLISSKGDKINVGVLLKQLEECGPVRAHHFRERQNFGFVQFLDSDSADNAIDKLNNRDVDGQTITIERIKRITPGKDPRVATVGSPQCSSLPTQLPSMIENKPDSTLVLKNLPFNLRQVQLQEILESINPSAPQSVNFHYDSIGVFRGMAFVKYRLVEDAIKVFDTLNGTDVYGRRVRLEYKRKVSKSSEIPPEVLEDDKLRKVWEQLREFKDDPTQTDVTFANFSGVQRMYIHNMAEKLKLSHTSVGEEPNRSIIVTNKKPVVGTPSKEDMGSYLLSTSPASMGLSSTITPNNSFTPSTPSMFIHAPPSSSLNSNGSGMMKHGSLQHNTLGQQGLMNGPSSLQGLDISSLSGSFGNHYLRPSTSPLSTSLTTPQSKGGSLTPNLVISENNLGTSWENNNINNNQNNSINNRQSNNSNNILSNPPFTTRGFGPIVSRDRSFSTPDGGIDSSSSSPSIPISSQFHQNHQQQYQQASSQQQFLSTSPVGTWRGNSKQQDNIMNNGFNSNHHPSQVVGFNNNNNNNNNNILNQQSFNISNSINIQQQQQQFYQQQQSSSFNNSNPNSLVSSPILRQPKGPDGTKGFSEDYRATRKMLPNSLVSSTTN